LARLRKVLQDARERQFSNCARQANIDLGQWSKASVSLLHLGQRRFSRRCMEIPIDPTGLCIRRSLGALVGQLEIRLDVGFRTFCFLTQT
jgi:hypothetical protein